jgi:hypothetical protein
MISQYQNTSMRLDLQTMIALFFIALSMYHIMLSIAQMSNID